MATRTRETSEAVSTLKRQDLIKSIHYLSSVMPSDACVRFVYTKELQPLFSFIIIIITTAVEHPLLDTSLHVDLQMRRLEETCIQQ